jgi:hypothetical protein
MSQHNAEAQSDIEVMERDRLLDKRYRCTSCGERFSTSLAFTRHRVGPPGKRRCRELSDMFAVGLCRNTAAWWYVIKGREFE